MVVKAFVYRGAPAQLIRLLRRHRNRVLAVVVIMEFESGSQAGGVAKAYAGDGCGDFGAALNVLLERGGCNGGNS